MQERDWYKKELKKIVTVRDLYQKNETLHSGLLIFTIQLLSMFPTGIRRH